MLTILILINVARAFSFSIIDYSLTRMITINGTSGSYFGYSILLQRGSPPIAIIGAPRKTHGSQNTGSVYRCNLNTLRCDEYTRISGKTGIYPSNKNGDFLGSVLSGDDIAGKNFFTCAPRFIEFNKGDYYTNGKCYHIKNSNNVNEIPTSFLPLSSESQISIDKRSPYYDAAYGEAGFSMAYSKNEENILLMGAPGKAQFAGAIVESNINSHRSYVLSPKSDLSKYQNSYLGYAVSWGRFIRNSRQVWFASGGPRGADLKGHVIFFDRSNQVIKEQLLGEEFGSYFGASLLVIHKKLGEGDDILVAAPMYTGNSRDEGCVYYYKNKNPGTFYPPIKLTTRKPSSRFGTALSEIGDIDLDAFIDCAISAPYEDDGIGAVYLYFGTPNGFSNDKFHRISPSHFSALFDPRIVIRGFGLGISNGNDINSDRYNDIAIGAYQTGQVFYFTTSQIFDVTMNLTTNMKMLYTSTTHFSVTFCVEFRFRSGNRDKSLPFLTYMLLDDDRVLSRRNITNSFAKQANNKWCTSQDVSLKRNHLNIEPLLIIYGYRVNDKSNQSSQNSLSIPVSYDCGADNVCQTDLSIKLLTPNPSTIIVGVNSELKVTVRIDNFGERAYQTKLYMKVPPEISLINLRECDFENGSYVCLVAQVLNETEYVEKGFLFDLTNLHPSTTDLPISLKVESIGRDDNPANNEAQLHVPVVLQSSPYIESRSLPESVSLNVSERVLRITHLFLVGNLGPSPLDLNLTIFVPRILINGSDVVEIQRMEGNVNGISAECSLSPTMSSNVKHLARVMQENGTKVVDCIKSIEHCISVVCQGGFYPKSNQNAIFSLKLILNTNLLVKFMEDTTKLIFISSAYFTNGTNDFDTISPTVIYVFNANITISFWIYLISIIAGVALLLLIIFILYKCHFFKRTYKELMESEDIKKNQEQTKSEQQVENEIQDEEL